MSKKRRVCLNCGRENVVEVVCSDCGKHFCGDCAGTKALEEMGNSNEVKCPGCGNLNNVTKSEHDLHQA